MSAVGDLASNLDRVGDNAAGAQPDLLLMLVVHFVASEIVARDVDWLDMYSIDVEVGAGLIYCLTRSVSYAIRLKPAGKRCRMRD